MDNLELTWNNLERDHFREVTKMVGVTEGNEKIYDVAWGYKRVGTIVGTDVGTVVGTRYVFWCFRAFFTNSYERKI